MVEELTLFEIEIENPQIGPRSLSRGSDARAEEPDEAEGASGGRRRVVPLLVLAIVAAGIALYRRRSGPEHAEVEEAAEADLATAT